MEDEDSSVEPRSWQHVSAGALMAQKLHEHVHSSQDELQYNMESLKRFRHEYEELLTLLHGLPAKLAHKVMVPLGPAAFFPGETTPRLVPRYLLGSLITRAQLVMACLSCNVTVTWQARLYTRTSLWCYWVTTTTRR